MIEYFKCKYNIGEHIRWYNDIINGKEILSVPYKIIKIEFKFNEYLYTIENQNDITQIYESGVYPTIPVLREKKLKRILNI